MSFESSEEEGEPDHEPESKPKPDLVWRSSRYRKAPERYGYSPDDWRCIFSLNANIYEPKFVEEALGMNDPKSWKIAMEEEIATLKRNDTWDLVPLPKG